MPNRIRAGVPRYVAEPVCNVPEVVADVVETARVEGRSGGDQHAHVDHAGNAHRDEHVDELEAEEPSLRVVALRDDAVLRQGRVQVDHVRHHGRAEDPDREQHALRTVEPRDEAAEHRAGIGVGDEHLDREAGDDHHDQRGDHCFETPEPVRLERKDPERGDTGDEGGREQRDPEEQVDRDRSADELGEVGRHRDHLGLKPERHRHAL